MLRVAFAFDCCIKATRAFVSRVGASQICHSSCAWKWNRSLRPAYDREKIMVSLRKVENNIPFFLLSPSSIEEIRDEE